MIELEPKDLKQSLYSAVREGKLEEATELINRLGITDFTSWEEGYVLLCEALRNQDQAMARLLLDSGSRVNSGSLSETPLHLALLNGQDDLAENILEKGAQIGILMKDGNPPLHWAIKNHRRKAVELLLKHGADANFERQETGLTPLQCAIISKEKEIIELLVNRGADINCCSKQTRLNPLLLAIKKMKMEIIELILDLGAEIEISGGKHDFLPHKPYTWFREFHDVFTYEHEFPGIADTTFLVDLASGFRPLHLASKLGIKETVQLLLDRGADVNADTEENLTPLHIAVMSGHEKVVKLLLERGAQVDYHNSQDQTALYVAVQKRNLKIVELILDNSPNINDQSNRDSLEVAVRSGCHKSKKIVEALLDYGYTGDPRCKDIGGLVHAAIKEGYLKILLDLLEWGVDVNNLRSTNRWGKNCTPLHTAVTHGREEVVKALINYGANINDEDSEGETPIIYAIKKNNVEMFNLLLALGAKVEGNTELLITAVKGRHKQIIGILLKHVDVNSTDVHGRTPLCYIYELEGGWKRYNHTIEEEIIDLLLSNGANPNIVYADGFTPLHHAVLLGSIEMVEGLIGHGATVNFEASFSKTPLHLSIERKNTEITRLLLQKGAHVNAAQKDGTTALHIAAESGCTGIAKLLLDLGANPNAETIRYFTPLLLAAKRGYQDIAEALLEFGADVNARDKCGSTALHGYSAHSEHTETIRLLLKKGAYVNAAQKGGTTALHIAAESGCTAIAKLLLDLGANPNAETRRYFTPLLLAAKRGYQDIAETLLEFGADVNATDECGSTALHISSEEGCVEVFATLLEHGADPNIRNKANRRGLECPMSPLCFHWNLRNGVCSCKPSNKTPSEILAKYVDEDRLMCRGDNASISIEKSLMEREKIENTNISFYDLLENVPGLLKVNRRYLDVLKATKSGYYKPKFPLFAPLIRTHLKKCLVIKNLFDQANMFLLDTFPKLPVSCIEEIVSYLSNEDLVVLNNYKPILEETKCRP